MSTSILVSSLFAASNRFSRTILYFHPHSTAQFPCPFPFLVHHCVLQWWSPNMVNTTLSETLLKMFENNANVFFSVTYLVKSVTWLSFNNLDTFIRLCKRLFSLYTSRWKDNPCMPQGLVYEGVQTEPIECSGGSAAQSSLLHCFDELLGVQHEENCCKTTKNVLFKIPIRVWKRWCAVIILSFL